MGDGETRGEIHVKLDDGVCYILDAYVEVAFRGLLVKLRNDRTVDADLALAQPAGDTKLEREGNVVLNILEAEADLAAPRILGLLAEREFRAVCKGGLQMALAVHAEPDGVVGLHVCVLARFCDEARHVRRAAEAGHGVDSGTRPDDLVVQLLGAAEHVLVEILIAVEADGRDGQVEHGALDEVEVLCLRVKREHAEIPHDGAERAAGLVIGGDVRQLVLIAVGLMHEADLCAVEIREQAVRRVAGVQRGVAAVEVGFLHEAVLPHSVEHGSVLLVAGLGVEVGNAGIQIGGADAVTHDLLVGAQRSGVLIVEGAVLDQIAHRDGHLCDFKEFLVAGGAVQLYQTHVVGGADLGLGFARVEEALIHGAQVSRRLYRYLQERVLAGNALIGAGRREQVAEVIALEIVDIAQTGAVAVGSLAVGDYLLGGDIAVGLLALADKLYVIVKLFFKLLVAALCNDISRRLKPLVEVAVAEGGAFVIALGDTCRDAEVLNDVEPRILILKHCADVGHGAVGRDVETLAPEAAVPVYVLLRNRIYLCIRAFAGVNYHVIFSCILQS